MTQDREWAQALIQHGDEWAFRQLYRRHTPRLYQFVLRLLGGAEADAEDIVQEAWVRAVGGLSSFQWRSAFSTWLTGIGLNLVREHFKRHSRAGRYLEAMPDLQSLPTPYGARLDLERAIALLPDGYRMVLVLHDVEGCTHKEIARALGISEGTSKSQLSNARKLVRSLLQGGGKRRDYERTKRRRLE